MRLPALAVPAAVLLVLAAGLSPTSLAAQGALDAQAPRMHAGVAIAIAQPTGEFKDYVSVGGGIHGYFRVNVDETGILSFRLQGGFLTYGNETREVCFSETVGCRIRLDLTTSNNIFVFGLGPELAFPLGSARAYGNATIGIGYFSTDSQVGGTHDNQPIASTHNYGDGGFAWTAGGGVQIPLGSIQEFPVALDFGVAHQGNGRREYLTRGGIRDLPDGSLEFDVKRSEADFLLWRIGLSLGIVPRF